MAIKDYFFNAIKDVTTGLYDRNYNAQDMTNYLDKLVGNGVFPNPSTNLQVMADSGMNIIVKAGQGWIDGHKLINTADMPLTVADSEVLLNRIDRVIFYVDYSTRNMGIEILQGTPATSPVAPSLIRTESRKEYSLATITINNQATSITQANITDTRPDSSVCGWVQGLVQQADTSTLYTQWETAYNEFFDQLNTWKDSEENSFDAWETAQRQAFDTWFSALTQDLNVNTYIQQFHKFVQLRQSDSKIVPLDMQGYTYDPTDVLFISLNGLNATETEDYLLDTRTTPVQVHLNFVGSPNMMEDVDIKVLKSKIGFSQLTDNNGNAIVTSGNDNLGV